MDKSRKFAAFLSIAIILMGFSASSYAQVDDEQEGGMYVEKPRVFYAGLIGGVNFCQVDGDYFAGYHKIGANVGAIAYAQIKKHLALSMEILYSQKGSKATIARKFADTVNHPGYILGYGINVNYAEIPIMINYFDKRKSHFGVGISYSRLASSTETLTTDPAMAAPDPSKYPFRKNNLDALAGFHLHLVKGLFLNVRFQYSLTPMRSAIPPVISRATQYNNLWVVRLMYLFI